MLNFEQLISFRPTFDKLGDQPTLRDMIFDYYCKKYQDTDKANASTKRYLDEVNEVFENQKKAFQLKYPYKEDMGRIK